MFILLSATMATTLFHHTSCVEWRGAALLGPGVLTGHSHPSGGADQSKCWNCLHFSDLESWFNAGFQIVIETSGLSVFDGWVSPQAISIQKYIIWKKGEANPFYSFLSNGRMGKKWVKELGTRPTLCWSADCWSCCIMSFSPYFLEIKQSRAKSCAERSWQMKDQGQRRAGLDHGL